MIPDVGVLPGSERFYYEPDDFTEKNLFYVPHAGIYKCSGEYEVNRRHLDACQIIIVDSGSLTIEYSGKIKTAHAGTIVLLDCRIPHKYYSSSDHLNMRWFHFTGNASGNYTNMLINTHGFCIPVPVMEIDECCDKILSLIQRKTPMPHISSAALHKLLALLSVTISSNKSGLEAVISESVDYITENFSTGDTSLETLAKHANISENYYIKKFREYNKVTPHQFIKKVRLHAAKEKLTTTSMSIEEIGDYCGFSNTSHFIMVFQKAVGLTPLQYRNLWL